LNLHAYTATFRFKGERQVTHIEQIKWNAKDLCMHGNFWENVVYEELLVLVLSHEQQKR